MMPFSIQKLVKKIKWSNKERRKEIRGLLTIRFLKNKKLHWHLKINKNYNQLLKNHLNLKTKTGTPNLENMWRILRALRSMIFSLIPLCQISQADSITSMTERSFRPIFPGKVMKVSWQISQAEKFKNLNYQIWVTSVELVDWCILEAEVLYENKIK